MLYQTLLFLIFFIENFCQRVTSQHTVNANSIPKQSRDYADSEYVIVCGMDRKGAEFIGNKHIHSLNKQTYRH